MAGARSAGWAFFVFPVRRDAQLGVFVHLFGTNLNLDRFPARPEHYRMNRLVTVRFRVRHVVVELIWQMAEVSMHYPQRGVAVLQAIGNDAHCTHVEQLVKGEMFFLHFAPDAVDVLRTTIDLRPHVLFFH
ncbi:hypothetical protein D3C72_896360 [compost metagenome]